MVSGGDLTHMKNHKLANNFNDNYFCCIIKNMIYTNS